jgi:hypothetical protein
MACSTVWFLKLVLKSPVFCLFWQFFSWDIAVNFPECVGVTRAKLACLVWGESTGVHWNLAEYAKLVLRAVATRGRNESCVPFLYIPRLSTFSTGYCAL